MTEDRMYTHDGCECGDAWCHGCDDPQTEADIRASYDEDDKYLTRDAHDNLIYR